jgi:broad specificity phosphatase PhoE
VAGRRVAAALRESRGADVTRLFVARHAETVWHQDNRYAGARSDPDLTERGHQQAAALAKAAVALKVDVLVSSPQRRARTTAGPTADALGLSPLVEPDLREVDFGELEGRTTAESDPEMVARFRADPVANVFPGAEPPADAATRAVAALHRLVTDHVDRTILVVAHNTLLRLVLCSLIGLPLEHYRRVFPRLDNVALTELRLPADPSDPAALLSYNCAH